MNLKQLNNLSYPAKTGYLAGGFVFFLALVAFLVLLPAIKKVKVLRSDIISQKIEMESRLNKQRNMSEVASKIKMVEPQLPLLSKSYINKNRELEFITMLEGVASQNRLEQTMNLDPAGGKTQGSYRTVPLNLSLRGTYFDILRYVIAVETGPYYINISNLSLTNAQSASRASTEETGLALNETPFNATLNATTYWK